MKRFRLGLLVLAIAVTAAGCDAGNITASDCKPGFPTLGSGC